MYLAVQVTFMKINKNLGNEKARPFRANWNRAFCSVHGWILIKRTKLGVRNMVVVLDQLK
jgi:hypothetical protein